MRVSISVPRMTTLTLSSAPSRPNIASESQNSLGEAKHNRRQAKPATTPAACARRTATAAEGHKGRRQSPRRPPVPRATSPGPRRPHAGCRGRTPAAAPWRRPADGEHIERDRRQYHRRGRMKWTPASSDRALVGSSLRGAGRKRSRRTTAPPAAASPPAQGRRPGRPIQKAISQPPSAGPRIDDVLPGPARPGRRAAEVGGGTTPRSTR